MHRTARSRRFNVSCITVIVTTRCVTLGNLLHFTSLLSLYKEHSNIYLTGLSRGQGRTSREEQGRRLAQRADTGPCPRASPPQSSRVCDKDTKNVTEATDLNPRLARDHSCASASHLIGEVVKCTWHSPHQLTSSACAAQWHWAHSRVQPSPPSRIFHLVKVTLWSHKAATLYPLWPPASSFYSVSELNYSRELT